MAEKVRVLCWVMTSPQNHDLKAKHVKATWGQHCNILLFISTAEGNPKISYYREEKVNKMFTTFIYICCAAYIFLSLFQIKIFQQ